MKLNKQLLIAGLGGTLVAFGGVVLAAGSGAHAGSTSLQNTAGNSALMAALGEPQTDLSVSVEPNKAPKVNFKLNGQFVPTDKPGVTTFTHPDGDGGAVSGQVVTSPDGNNVSMNANSQNSSYAASSSTTPGNSTVTNQTTTTSSFNNSFSSINSSSAGSSSSFSSSTTFNNGQFQQNP